MTRASDITPALLAELRAECGRSLICYVPSEIMLRLLAAAECGFWRDLKDGAPNEGQAVVLVTPGPSVVQAYWTEALRSVGATHWMPIPDFPPEPAPPPPIDWGERART